MNREVNPIEQWQESVPDGEVPPSSEDIDRQLVSDLSAAASKLFLSITSELADRFPANLLLRTQREYGYFQLWCDGYNVLSGEIDEILAESTRLRLSVYRRLVHLCLALLSVVATISGPKPPAAIATASDQDPYTPDDTHLLRRETGKLLTAAVSEIAEGDDSDSETYSNFDPLEEAVDQSKIESLVEDVATAIECLVELGPCFEEPVVDELPEELAIPPASAVWEPADLLAARISHRYPKIDHDLARALGSANWERLQRLLRTRETNMQRNGQAAVKRKESGPGTIVASDYHDSGIGTSITASTLQYAETVVSYHGSKGGTIRIPPIPHEGLQGQLFTCEICAIELRIPSKQAKSLWKKHVLSDLLPYSCISPTCKLSSVEFSDVQAWTAHVATEHGLTVTSGDFECPLCGDKTNSNKISHLANHLEEISLTILPANVQEDDDHSNAEEKESLHDQYQENEDETAEASTQSGVPLAARVSTALATAPIQTIRRGPWSEMEDHLLKSLVQAQGNQNWVRIANSLQTRTPKQCRDRYHQALKPGINRDPITEEEGAMIQKLVGQMGKRWAEIARRLPGRSDNMIKGWWNGSQNRSKRLDRGANGLRASVKALDQAPLRPIVSTGQEHIFPLELPPLNMKEPSLAAPLAAFRFPSVPEMGIPSLINRDSWAPSGSSGILHDDTQKGPPHLDNAWPRMNPTMLVLA
ncbi:hypothetical protein OQA88_9128 [Cercophora sp. LCS_1]